MDNRQYLLDQIKKCRRKMNLAKLMDFGILYAAAGGIAGVICELAALFRPFYYADLAAALCFAAGLFAGICHGVLRRADLMQAASRLDSYGLEERMLTACENRDSEDEFAQMQREDALLHYNRVRGQIRIPLLPDKRHILALFAAIFTVTGIHFIPSPVREEAKLRREVQEQAKEDRKELEKLLDALEAVDRESLTQEQREKLQELLDTMELSREEFAGADSWENLSAAAQRLDYKYEQAARSLEELAGQMENPKAAGIADAEAFAKALAQAEENGQQMAAGGTPSGNVGQGEKEAGGQEENNTAGGGDQGGENGSGEETGQGGENGSGEGTGQGEGNGSGEGTGQGEGNGSGEGTGQGKGSGRGTGSSEAVHDYVSIPNAMGDDASLTGNKTGDQDSDYYRQQNGLAWEGDHVDYSSVIGEYTDSAYEGIANGRYPSGMETVIRDYFENLNQ